MRFNRLAMWIGTAALGFATQACVVRDNTPVNSGYGYGYSQPAYQASVSVGTPSPYYTSSMPPEPLYESMTASPGYGYVWIDGYWHWNGYEWTWVSGRWERQQEGFVYVQPYYDYVGGQYVYTPGYWSRPDRVPAGWQVRDHRDGRPAVVAPPPGWHTPPPQGGWQPHPNGGTVGTGPQRPVYPPNHGVEPQPGTFGTNPAPGSNEGFHPHPVGPMRPEQPVGPPNIPGHTVQPPPNTRGTNGPAAPVQSHPSGPVRPTNEPTRRR